MPESPGMTFREWQWTQFAKAFSSGIAKSLIVAAGNQAKSPEDLEKSLRQGAHLCCEWADIMMAAIAERESNG